MFTKQKIIGKRVATSVTKPYVPDIIVKKLFFGPQGPLFWKVNILDSVKKNIPRGLTHVLYEFLKPFSNNFIKKS